MNTMNARKTISGPVPARRRQAGVTLVELMVALLLSLLLVAGMVQVFAGNRATYEFNQGLSRIQENARFALDHIAYSTRMAAYSGCLSDVAYYNNLAVAFDFRDDIEDGVRGYDYNDTGMGDALSVAANPATDANTGSWTPVLPADLAGEVARGSDVLLVRGIAPAAEALVTPFSISGEVYVAPGHGFEDGEILVVSDCQKASLFQLTDSAAVGAASSLVHSDAGAFLPGNDEADWGPEQEYGLGGEVSRLQAHAFYVGVNAAGRPALFQYRLAGSTFVAEELVEGIETMQVRYGIDGDNNGSVDEWVTGDAVGDWTRVLSIEVTLLARSIDEYGTEEDTATYNVGGTEVDPAGDDRRLRQVFSTTIGVRNRLP